MGERAIFFEALDKEDPAERAAYLDGACGGDPGLRERIEALLRSDAAAGDFLDMPAAQQLAAGTDAPADGGPPAGGETPERQPEAGIPLDFLTPSQRQDSLGRLGYYEVLEVVGQGGMGIVLRAFDDKLHRVVAIKVLAPALAATGSARQRFVREAQAAAAVTHDNVIAIHAVEDQGPVPYLVMQFIDGPTLQEQVDRVGPLPLKELLRIGMQVAAGLAAAHAQGLVHRDVKPANILLENGIQRVKITDFGLARAVDDGSLTQSGFIAGTPGYMSPEQANGEPVDHRSDLFSLGSVLYTLCAGHAPFRASSTVAILKRVCDEVPRPIRELNAEVPAWLAAIVARLHAKSAAGRYQTAAEVADLLSRHLTCLQQPDPGGHVFDAPDRQARWKPAPRIAAPIAVLLGIVILGTSIAAYRVSHRRGKPPVPTGPTVPVQRASPWQPRPPLTPEELARRPSPLDALKREAMGLPEGAPPEMLAVLGESPRLQLPERTNSHWMAQTGDGRLLAVPCGKNIVLFETRTGTLYRTLTGHTHQPYRPAFSPDGRRLASGSGDSILRVWDVATGREELTLKEHGTWLWTVAYDPQGKRLASADAGGTVKVWDAGGGLVKSFQAHAKGANHIAFSPDGKRLATGSLDGTCKLWDPDTWQEVRTLSANGKTFEAVAWSRDGKMLAAGDDAQVIVWDTGTYEVLHTLKTPGKGLTAFSPDGRTLVTARCDCRRGERHAFTRWDLKTGARQVTRELPTRDNIAFFQLSPDGRTVFVSRHDPEDPRVRAYDSKTGQERFSHGGHTGGVASVAFSPDGGTLATGGYDHMARLWDLARWKAGEAQPPARELSGHADTVCSLAFSADGSRLVTSGFGDGLFLLWDPASGRKVHDLVGPQSHWTRVAISPDGATVAVGGVDGSVNFWDARTAVRKEPRRWNATAVRTVAFSPDGQLLASGDKGATVQVFEAATGRWRHAFRTGSPVTNVAFSPNGQTLAAACDAPGSSVHLWDLETTAERVLTGHANHILGLAFDPAGGRVATASWDGTARLWDVTKPGQEARVFDFRRTGQAHGVAFSPEGRYLAVGLQDGTVAILRVGR